jgi:excisionase family DNA binding protein
VTETDDILDTQAAAELLRVGRHVLYALCGRNQIPHRRVGKHLRFSRAALMLREIEASAAPRKRRRTAR